MSLLLFVYLSKPHSIVDPFSLLYLLSSRLRSTWSLLLRLYTQISLQPPPHTLLGSWDSIGRGSKSPIPVRNKESHSPFLFLLTASFPTRSPICPLGHSCCNSCSLQPAFCIPTHLPFPTFLCQSSRVDRLTRILGAPGNTLPSDNPPLTTATSLSVCDNNFPTISSSLAHAIVITIPSCRTTLAENRCPYPL